MFQRFDIIVVGAGHAGCEAARSSALMGAETLLITQNLNAIAQLSCNPAMGGVAKGQIVREIDALGGMSGIITDQNTMQFRMLNRSKGPAMWSPRAQVDNVSFGISWRQHLETIPHLQLWQDEVVDLIINNGTVEGVITKIGLKIEAKAVILTNGTFLNGKIHIGETNFEGGRIGEEASKGLSEKMREIGFEIEKLKTGTPMRVVGDSINFSVLQEQKGDERPEQFSFINSREGELEQRSCYLAYTNDDVHNILKEGFEKSPMFQGRIQGRGPRYCPSIEDKIERFSDKNKHQLFIEPESRFTNLYYINGFSSSLPLEVQYKALRTIPGFEKAIIQKPGYAIEYDYFPPTQLKASLETKLIRGLFFAGQINGTTGYEEAGAQGLMAGINACMKLFDKESIILKRSESYIGVLIDDLITKGVDEPYRMFTSRAEYRILLRQDNADQRLTPIGYSIGLASKERLMKMEAKKENIDRIVNFIKNNSALPEEVNEQFQEINTPAITQKTKLSQLLLRPQVDLNMLKTNVPYLNTEIDKTPFEIKSQVEECAEILVKYESYIKKEEEIVNKLSHFENLVIKDDFDYHALKSLSFEAREKLTKIRPKTIGQAGRISGVSPADISVLVIYISR
ncbi:MAG: tRNA uridine-5-carboxymethylaminomethyl(34) synthesis enzyme MnmG [Bacteroidales bacterium]|nr:tRNA uridine-5-carboxymethylaminomethyl(34) synthesis enzyme MnmG [Bacteroidales bacterium]MEE1220666.1 tRNA uridine-5-carboxymethylaminomethyl(34) synthesis enzyme MnmG [Bacteroidales bacterium]